MPDLTITIPAFTLTLEGANVTTKHECEPECDCPTALARVQLAIDTDRRRNGVQQRPLSGRIYEMRNAAPPSSWFDDIGYEVSLIETVHTNLSSKAADDAAAWAARCEASDAATPAERAAALHTTVEGVVADLARAELLPVDHEYAMSAGESRVYSGNLRFHAAMTGALDAPAAHYVITTFDDDGDPDNDGSGVERFTTDLGAVRSWLIAWAAAATYA